jgi:hypothetical protein
VLLNTFSFLSSAAGAYGRRDPTPEKPLKAAGGVTAQELESSAGIFSIY